MATQLDTSIAEARTPWLRVSVGVTIAVLLGPYIVFGSNFACHRVLPQEKLSWQEILLPPSGAPFALVLVLLALPGSSWARRIALIGVGLCAIVAIWKAVGRIEKYW